MTDQEIIEKYQVSGSHYVTQYHKRESILADKTKKICHRCDGSGNAVFSGYEKCSECDGRGSLE